MAPGADVGGLQIRGWVTIAKTGGSSATSRVGRPTVSRRRRRRLELLLERLDLALGALAGRQGLGGREGLLEGLARRRRVALRGEDVRPPLQDLDAPRAGHLRQRAVRGGERLVGLLHGHVRDGQAGGRVVVVGQVLLRRLEHRDRPAPAASAPGRPRAGASRRPLAAPASSPPRPAPRGTRPTPRRPSWRPPRRPRPCAPGRARGSSTTRRRRRRRGSRRPRSCASPPPSPRSPRRAPASSFAEAQRAVEPAARHHDRGGRAGEARQGLTGEGEALRVLASATGGRRGEPRRTDRRAASPAGACVEGLAVGGRRLGLLPLAVQAVGPQERGLERARRAPGPRRRPAPRRGRPPSRRPSCRPPAASRPTRRPGSGRRRWAGRPR